MAGRQRRSISRPSRKRDQAEEIAMRQVEGQAISLRNHIQGDVGRHVAATWVRPSTGYPYARCPRCRKQIFARTVRSATFVQTVLLLKQNMAIHMKTEHGSEGGTGD